MLKAFARWLFIQTHYRELLDVKQYVIKRTAMTRERILSTTPQRLADRMRAAEQAEGALEALALLDLLLK